MHVEMGLSYLAMLVSSSGLVCTLHIAFEFAGAIDAVGWLDNMGLFGAVGIPYLAVNVALLLFLITNALSIALAGPAWLGWLAFIALPVFVMATVKASLVASRAKMAQLVKAKGHQK